MEQLMGFGGLGLVITSLIISLGYILIPFFVWGIYNSNVRQEQLLRENNEILAKANKLERIDLNKRNKK